MTLISCIIDQNIDSFESGHCLIDDLFTMSFFSYVTRLQKKINNSENSIETNELTIKIHVCPSF